MKDYNLFAGLDLFADAGTLTNISGQDATTLGPVNSYDGTHYAPTTGSDMSPTMKVFYDTALLQNARAKAIYKQLGQNQALPANHGDTVEWRKWNTIPKALKPLEEGVIPVGKRLGMTKTTVSVLQYGDYVSVSDRLKLHAVDSVILGATQEMGAAAGETDDTLTRNVLVAGTNVMFADTTLNGAPTSTPVGRYELQADNNRLTPDTVNRAQTWLKKNNAPYFAGNKYVAVIHPSVTYDLRSHKDWIEAHKYAATTQIFNGEIGELHGVRFIESTTAPVFKGEDLFTNQAYLTVAAYSASGSGTATEGVSTNYRVTVSETLTADIGKALIGRKVHYYDESAGKLVGTGTIVGTAYGSKYVWLDDAPPVTLVGTSGHEDLLYPGEGGDNTSGDCAVYATLFFGKDAFAVVDPEGMGMQTIIKPASEIGGPLEQFSTIGYKFETAAKILYQERMLRVESCSAYSTVDEAN